MFRDTRALLENNLNVLQARKRELDAEIQQAEQQLAVERARYEEAVEHWRKAGPEALMTPKDRALARRETRRTFRITFVSGMAIPVVIGVLIKIFAAG